MRLIFLFPQETNVVKDVSFRQGVLLKDKGGDQPGALWVPEILWGRAQRKIMFVRGADCGVGG